MNVFDEVAMNLFGDQDQRGRYGPDFVSDYDNYEGDPMSVEQLRKIQETDPYRSGNPNGFRGHPEYDYMYECLEDIQSQWQNVKIKLDGRLGTPDEWWVETVYLLYDDVDNYEEFEEWAVLSFKSSLGGEIKGVSPSDPRVTFGNDHFRYTSSDDHLLATTEEFDFYEDEEYGKYVRLWWDD